MSNNQNNSKNQQNQQNPQQAKMVSPAKDESTVQGAKIDLNADKAASTQPANSAPPVEPVVVEEYKADQNKLVQVKPRQTVAKMRFGQDWYQFIANKPCLVPLALAKHLEEKGIL